MSSFAPGTSREEMAKVERSLYGTPTSMAPMPPMIPQGRPNQLDDILRAIGVPTTTPPMQPVPPQMVFGGGMGEPDMNFRPRDPQADLMPPGFVAQPVPMSPIPPRGGPVQSLPPMPPRLPEGRPIGGVPPYMPNPMESGYYTNPNQPPSGETVPPQSQYGVPTSSDGKWLFNDGRWMPNSTAKTFPMPESRPEEVFPGPGQQTQGKGLDVQKLLDMLRGMQGKGQTIAPQAPYIPDLTMPVPEMSPADIARLKMRKAAQEAEKLRIMGEMPRMPSPSPVPPSQGGRSAMGLGGLLNAIRASRKA